MKKTFILSAVATLLVVACGQTPEEKLKAFDQTIEDMENEYYAMRDSLSSDADAWEEYYTVFMDEYKSFNLDNAKKNLDNEVAVHALLNLRGMLTDEESAEILNGLSAEMLENEKVQSLKKGLDARIETAEGKMYKDLP